jgi:hypothetical protein
MIAGVVTPEKPLYTTWVLVLAGPSGVAHVPVPVGHLLVAALFTPLESSSVWDLVTGLGFLAILFGYSVAFSFAPYWLLVHAGWVLKKSALRLTPRAEPPTGR